MSSGSPSNNPTINGYPGNSQQGSENDDEYENYNNLSFGPFATSQIPNASSSYVLPQPFAPAPISCFDAMNHYQNCQACSLMIANANTPSQPTPASQERFNPFMTGDGFYCTLEGCNRAYGRNYPFLRRDNARRHIRDHYAARDA